MADNKLTLLDMVQDILSDMSSDEVNSIDDSVEAQQVAQIIKSTYMQMIANMDRPWLNTLFQLESGVSGHPTRMKLPSNIDDVHFVKYNVRATVNDDIDFKTLIYKTPQEFLELSYRLNSTAVNVDTLLEGAGAQPVLVWNDRMPTYWTSFDDEYIYIDAYDSTVESNLQGNKTSCYGQQEPSWTMSDTFIPDLPSHMFAWLLAESKNISIVRVKQTQDPTAAKQARDGKTRHQYAQFRTSGTKDGPDFGRK